MIGIFHSLAILLFFADLLENPINIPIPNSKRKMPIHDVTLKYSPNRKTPNKAAVNGSANESVTAVEEETWIKPLEKRKYAIAVAMIPNWRLTPTPRKLVIHDISKTNKKGAKQMALSVKTTATTDKEECLSTKPLLKIV